MVEELTPEQVEMLAKAKSTVQTLEPVASGPPPAVTPTGDAGERGSRQEWGPYDDYHLVQCPTGVYGVPKGKILFFIPISVFSRRENRMVVEQQRLYRDPDQTQEDEIRAFRARNGPEVVLLEPV